MRISKGSCRQEEDMKGGPLFGRGYKRGATIQKRISKGVRHPDEDIYGKPPSG
jgi:hypothetical protein